MRALPLISRTLAGARHLRVIDMEHGFASKVRIALGSGQSGSGSDLVSDQHAIFPSDS